MAERIPCDAKLQVWVPAHVADAVERLAADMFIDTSTMLRQLIVTTLRQHGIPVNAQIAQRSEDRVGA